MSKKSQILALLLITACPEGHQPGTSATATTGSNTIEPATGSTTDSPTTEQMSTDTQMPTTGQTTKCGDGTLDPEEECDDGADTGMPGQMCTAQCKFNICGDAHLGPGESCDQGERFNDGSYNHCNPDCQGNGGYCSDGIVQEPEVCDDGNLLGNGSCLYCSQLAKCGDGQLWQVNLPEGQDPEECDDGPDNADDAACLSTCKLATCGDGFVQTAIEECDDGNQNDNDACSNQCKFKMN